ncbi:MAG: hypothetical protein L0Y73_05940 [Candidatus Aminicenantes bacterium]|nr:hypothetical protein [Candidatus Aminicenantes bacterium]
MIYEDRLPGKYSALHAAYFFIGFFSLISQTILIREFLVVIYGNEIILGVLFFNWLMGIFAGSLCGAVAADKYKNPLLLFVVSIFAMCLLMPAAVVCARLLYAISGTAPGTYIGFFKVFLFSGIFVIPPVFFIGFSFPIAARLQAADDPGRNEKVQRVSRVYIFEAAGFLCGGVIYTFLLVGRFNPYFIACLAILPLLGVLAVILRQAKYHKALILTVILLALDSGALISPLNGKIDRFTIEKRWQSVSQTPLVYSVDSKYQNIAAAGFFKRCGLYLNTMFTALIPEEEENKILAAHLFCQHPQAKRALIIGDALTGLAKHLSAYDLDKIVSVEIDPLVVKTILKFLPAAEKQVLQDKRFSIVIADGRKYVKDLGSRPPSFDIVFLNTAEPATLLSNRYYTMDFFLDLAGIMPPDGVVVSRITSSENYGKGLVGEYTAAIYHTIAAVFPHIVIAPGTYNYIFASRKKSSLSHDPEILANRYTKTGVKPGKLGLIFRSLYPEDKTKFIESVLANSPRRTINRDEQPRANFYFSKIIGWYAGSNLQGLLDFLEKIEFKILLAFLLFLLLARLLYIYRRKAKSAAREPIDGRLMRFHILLAVFCCGAAGLAMELVIIYIFQAIFGYIYHVIGLIIALFMSGLPAGAVFADFLLIKKKFKIEVRAIRLIIIMQISLALLALFIGQAGKLFINRSAVDQILLFFLTVLVGFAVGMLFPLALGIYLSREKKTGRAAGLVNACDHLGAAGAALFMGALFLPLLGIFKICLLTAACLLASAILLTTDMFARRSQVF